MKINNISLKPLLNFLCDICANDIYMVQPLNSTMPCVKDMIFYTKKETTIETIFVSNFSKKRYSRPTMIILSKISTFEYSVCCFIPCMAMFFSITYFVCAISDCFTEKS